MLKTLSAGVAAFGLIATASFAQQAYESSTSRTTTVVAPPAVIAPGTTTTTTTQTADPATGATVERSTTQTTPAYTAPVSSYRQEKTVTSNGEVVEKTTRSDTVTPSGRTTTYSKTTTGSDD